MTEDIFHSYIAGLIDSGGNITFRKDVRTKNSVYPVVTLKSYKKENLYLIKNKFGGSLTKNSSKWELILTHRKAENILKSVYKFLIVKKDEADLVFKLYSDRYTKKYEPERKKGILEEFIKVKKIKEVPTKTGKGSIKKWLGDVDGSS
ncbi:hypothetical protein [Persephonella sp.]